MNYEILTTDELMEVVCGGDGQAFDELYNRFWEQCYVFAFRRLKTSRRCQRAWCRNVFVTLWHKKDTLGGEQQRRSLPLHHGAQRNPALHSRAIKDHAREEEMEQLLQPVLDDLLDPYQKEVQLRLLNDEVRLLPGHAASVPPEYGREPEHC